MRSVIMLRLICIQELLLAVARMQLPAILLKGRPIQNTLDAGSNTTHDRYGAADLPDSRTLIIQTTKVRMKPEIHKASTTLH